MCAIITSGAELPGVLRAHSVRASKQTSVPMGRTHCNGALSTCSRMHVTRQSLNGSWDISQGQMLHTGGAAIVKRRTTQQSSFTECLAVCAFPTVPSPCDLQGQAYVTEVPCAKLNAVKRVSSADLLAHACRVAKLSCAAA